MTTRARRAGRLALSVVAAGGLLTAVVPAVPAGAEAADPHVVSGGMAGVVPARDAHGAKPGGGGTSLLSYHNGPIMPSTVVQPIFWGSSWQAGNAKVTAMNGFYSGVGGTSYMGTNTEYKDSSNASVGSGVTASAAVLDTQAAPSGAPSTSAVLAEVVSAMHGVLVDNAYYPVYSDQPRGSAGYCAWHSTGTYNGTRVQFGFFFNLDGDSGCNPGTYSGVSTSQGVLALGNVTGHELSEMVTDPQLNAWYDRRGYENADKCAWTFSGHPISFGGYTWKIQGNFSNKAYGTRSGYDGGGCIDGT